jgi:hypothetical protein
MIIKNDILSFTFNEYFNINKANILIKNWDDTIKQLPEERQKKILEKAKEFDPLNALKKIVKNKNGINSVKYSFSKSSKNYGRLFAKTASLQGLPREFRSLLAIDTYKDIDFENCHPNALEQYCNKNGIKCDNLSYYNSNRNNILENLSNDLNINKSDCKNLILTLLNGGNRQGLICMNDFLKNFKNEMNIIHNIIVQLNPKIFKQVKRSWGDNEHNLNGKVVNRILCDIENNILLTAVEYLMNKGFNIDCLIFDGFLIRIEEDKIINDELLEEVSKYVFENTEYNLKLINKDFDNIINLDLFKNDNVLIDLSNEVTYYKDKQEFEKDHFKIMYPPSYVSLDNDGELYIQHTETFHQSFSHKSTKILRGEGPHATIDEVQFSRVWIHDKDIRVYKKADFYPNKSKCPIDVYNLFKGFKAEQYEAINNIEKINILIEPIINQLKVIAQNDYEFLIIFYAFIIQHPDLKTNVNIIISGKDGCGKSIINDFFRKKILGDDISAQTDDTDSLFSRFSNIFVKRIFIQIDEISKDDFTKKKLEKLKNITTSSTIKYEKKGFDEIIINNYVNTLMTTNNDFTIPVSQTDRRNIFFKCNDTYVGNYEYWTQFNNHISKDEVARAFYEYLLNYNLSSVLKTFEIEGGLQFIKPNTKYGNELKSLCILPIYRFYSALTSYTPNDFNNEYIHDYINNEEKITFKASELYDKYCSWYLKCGFNNKPNTLTRFFLDIKSIFLSDINNIGCFIKKEINNTFFIYIINKKKLKDYLINTKSYDEDAFIY